MYKLLGIALGMTSLQVVWNWRGSDRLFTQLNFLFWVIVLLLLGVYGWYAYRRTVPGSLLRLQQWLYTWLTRRRVAAISLTALSVFVLWYAIDGWGRTLGGFDYGAQFYRLKLLHQIFPDLVAYNPWVNGGYEALDPLATGTVNLFLVSYPIAALLSPEVAFQCLPVLLIVLLPGVLYASARLVGRSPSEALLSAVFALMITPVGHAGMTDLLFTGNMPFIFSCQLSVPVFALGYRVFVLGRNPLWGLAGIILLGSLASFHPLFSIVIGPVFLALVCAGRLSVRRRIVYCAVITLGLLLLNGAEIKEILWHDSGRLVSHTFDVTWRPLTEWLAKLDDNFLGIRGALVLAAVVGLVRLRRDPEATVRRLGSLLICTLLYYVVLIMLGEALMPGLQLFHFVTPLSFFLLLSLGPAWAVVQALWQRLETAPGPQAYFMHATLVLLALFLSWPFLTYFERFPYVSRASEQMIEWLRTHASTDGRVFFFRPVRRLDASAAFDQVKSGRPAMGIVGHVVPNAILDIATCLTERSETGECSALYNIHYAVTFSSGWGFKDVADPEGDVKGYELVQTFDGRIRIYQNSRPSTYFLRGQGQVIQRVNHLAVTAEPAEEVVLKFFWVPGLRTIPPLAIEPYPLPNGQAFIKVHTARQRHFDIVYRSYEPLPGQAS